MKDLVQRAKKPTTITIEKAPARDPYTKYTIEQRRTMREDYQKFLDKHRLVVEMEMALADARDELRELNLPAIAAKHNIPAMSLRQILGIRTRRP